MNERINELWGQALDRAVPDTYSSLSWSQVEKIKAVFAELLIKDCAQFIDTEAVRLCEYKDSLEPWDGHMRGDCDLVIEKCVDLSVRMKRHFGVK